MKIKQIWSELENDKSFNKGLLIRRFSGTVLPDIFIAMQQPEKLMCIAASISIDIPINISAYGNLMEIQLDFVPDMSQNGKVLLVFKLINNQHKDIFAVLCEDLIHVVSAENNEKKLVQTLLNRFEKWKSLFSKFIIDGLTPEEQRGLFGELYFLRLFLVSKNADLNVLNSWVGGSRELRDFQFNNWALEVKTTIGNNHQKIHISSERQLDTTHVKNLYLFHLSLEKVQESGESLPSIISSIYDLLMNDTFSLNRFKAKIYEAGYFEHQKDLYSKIGYHIRQENFYKIEDQFPRIQENELRSGIGDVNYSIIISQCQDYLQSRIQVINNLSI
jgi:hypothetical protein